MHRTTNNFNNYLINTNLNECTFNKTGYNYSDQFWKRCYDCFPSDAEGACLNCISICHDGHRIGPLQKGRFFCDCGDQGLCTGNNNPKIIKRVYNRPGTETGGTWTGHGGPGSGRFRSGRPGSGGPGSGGPGSGGPGSGGPGHGGPGHGGPGSGGPGFGGPGSGGNGFVDVTNYPIAQSPITSSPIIPPIDSLNFNKSALSQVIDKVAFSLFNILPTNKIISPASIMFALSIVHTGAHGKTSEEITNFFGRKLSINDIEGGHNMLNMGPTKVVNGLFVRQGCSINPNYHKSLRSIMMIKNEVFDNSFVKKVNNFIAKNTNGLIRNLVSSVTQDTIAILVNTIYFKADWKNPFQKHDTQKMMFNNEQIVDMMYQTKSFLYCEDSANQVLSMPYKNPAYEMMIILPKRYGFTPTLSANVLDAYSQQMHKTKVQVYIPKFTHRQKIELKNILQKLGVNKLFTSAAELEGVGENIVMSEILHEAVVIVDETGTEAAAATVICMESLSCLPQQNHITFKADHTFIYAIRHKPSNTTLFLGCYA